MHLHRISAASRSLLICISFASHLHLVCISFASPPYFHRVSTTSLPHLRCISVVSRSVGIIKRVAREEATAAMTEQRRNARMRENIGGRSGSDPRSQIPDPCAPSMPDPRSQIPDPRPVCPKHAGSQIPDPRPLCQQHAGSQIRAHSSPRYPPGKLTDPCGPRCSVRIPPMHPRSRPCIPDPVHASRIPSAAGQYVDSCAEVGMAEREFFDIADL